LAPELGWRHRPSSVGDREDGALIERRREESTHA